MNLQSVSSGVSSDNGSTIPMVSSNFSITVLAPFVPCDTSEVFGVTVRQNDVGDQCRIFGIAVHIPPDDGRIRAKAEGHFDRHGRSYAVGACFIAAAGHHASPAPPTNDERAALQGAVF